jgi:virginiamycin B lyase
LWVTLYSKGKLLHVDPIAAPGMHEYALPGGPNGGPYAVSVDGTGIVWANEFATDTIVRLDPQTGQMRPFPLPSKGVGIRKMFVDAEGRLWYMGSPMTVAWVFLNEARGSLSMSWRVGVYGVILS